MSVFSPEFSVVNVGPGFIMVTDLTNYANSDLVTNFSNRYLVITTPDGKFLPNADGSHSFIRDKIPFAIGLGAGDVVVIPTGYNWDICLTVELVLVPIVAVAGSIYLTRQDLPTLAFCGQAYINLQKQFYSPNSNIYNAGISAGSTSNGSVRYRDLLLKKSNQLRIEIDNAEIRASLGDLIGSQDSLNNANFLAQSAANN